MDRCDARQERLKRLAPLKKIEQLLQSHLGSLVRSTLGTPIVGRAGALLAVALVAALLFVGLFYVWTRMQIVQIGYEIASLEKKNRILNQRKRELLLEIASLQSPGELERQARQKANLIVPPMRKVVHVP
jgi:cell division protein FtsL